MLLPSLFPSGILLRFNDEKHLSHSQLGLELRGSAKTEGE